MTGHILLCELHCDGMVIEGQAIQIIGTRVSELVALAVTQKSLYISSHAQNGGILQSTQRWCDKFDVHV